MRCDITNVCDDVSENDKNIVFIDRKKRENFDNIIDLTTIIVNDIFDNVIDKNAKIKTTKNVNKIDIINDNLFIKNDKIDVKIVYFATNSKYDEMIDENVVIVKKK